MVQELVGIPVVGVETKQPFADTEDINMRIRRGHGPARPAKTFTAQAHKYRRQQTVPRRR